MTGNKMVMDERHIALARHALGLPNDASKSYRNRFSAVPGSFDHQRWHEMELGGFAISCPSRHYILTQTGAEAVLLPGETLCKEDFPHYVAPTSQDPWGWYSGTSEEWYSHGPFATREDAIEEARQDALGEFKDEDGQWKIGVHVVEARADPLRLADWIDAEGVLEHADERLVDSDRVGSEGDDGPWFECSIERHDDLVRRLKAACDEWQAAHGLEFICRTFSGTRNQDYVAVPHPADDAKP